MSDVILASENLERQIDVFFFFAFVSYICACTSETVDLICFLEGQGSFCFVILHVVTADAETITKDNVTCSRECMLASVDVCSSRFNANIFIADQLNQNNCCSRETVATGRTKSCMWIKPKHTFPSECTKLRARVEFTWHKRQQTEVIPDENRKIHIFHFNGSFTPNELEKVVDKSHRAQSANFLLNGFCCLFEC